MARKRNETRRKEKKRKRHASDIVGNRLSTRSPQKKRAMNKTGKRTHRQPSSFDNHSSIYPFRRWGSKSRGAFFRTESTHSQQRKGYHTPLLSILFPDSPPTPRWNHGSTDQRVYTIYSSHFDSVVERNGTWLLSNIIGHNVRNHDLYYRLFIVLVPCFNLLRCI